MFWTNCAYLCQTFRELVRQGLEIDSGAILVRFWFTQKLLVLYKENSTHPKIGCCTNIRVICVGKKLLVYSQSNLLICGSSNYTEKSDS